MSRSVTLIAASLSLALAACGGSGGGTGGDPSDAGGSRSESFVPLPSGRPEPLLLLEDDPQRINDIPDVVLVETLAATGLQVAYTSGDQRGRIDPLYVEAQWQHMQSCVGLLAPAPLVVVRSGAVEPFTAADDVIRDLDGSATASASAGPVATIQVRETVFEEAQGRNRGFELRAIMGRHLWLSADLPERDYPFLCAREEATPG